MNSNTIEQKPAWNKGKLVGQKLPLKLKEIWAIRIRLQLASRTRELAMFNLAIDSKLRACDLVNIHPYSQRAFWTATDLSFKDWATFEFFNRAAFHRDLFSTNP